MKVFNKAFSALYLFAIKLMRYVNVGLYMKKYTQYLKKKGMKIHGTPKFISGSVYFDSADYSKIEIGNNVTISREVLFLTHDYTITTALASIGTYIGRGEGELYTLKGIKIGENCFIGARASILPGTTIGNNVIVGSCSVVKGTIPDNSIVIGNPCKVIGNTQEWVKKQMEKKDYLVE
jgi:acetyltransferase-like isoleucine patch superfamily enzyme